MSSNISQLIQTGLEHHQAGRLQEAEIIYQSILKEQPQHPDALHLLGVIAHTVGKNDIAVNLIETAIKINPDVPDFYNNCGEAYRALQKNDLAIVRYEQALAIKPDYAEPHSNLGITHAEQGQMEEACTHFEQALAIKPNFAEAHHHLTMSKPKQDQVHVIEKLLTNPSISAIDSMRYHYALGNIFDSAKSFTQAFEHYNKANTLKRKSITYDSQSHSDFVDRLIKTYSKSYFQKFTKCGSNSELPTFIIGMPRSGTTLVEQIISSHAQVYGAGELESFRRIEAAITKRFEASNPYPECMSLCDESVVLDFSAKYLGELDNYSQVAIRITDKMPINFLLIGLIKILFPKARIIHCRRNALDTCTSIFLNYFVDANEYSFDLNDIGQYYLDYERLMVHWHGLFPTEIFDVQYEELVMNQEKISRQLIEHIGLEWDDKCLDFHLNKRIIKTASTLQVRQPIYKNSINRWKQYERHLEPLKAILHQLV